MSGMLQMQQQLAAQQLAQQQAQQQALLQAYISQMVRSSLHKIYVFSLILLFPLLSYNGCSCYNTVS